MSENLEVRGARMYALAERLWNFPRSLTGDGVRLTLAEIARNVGGLRLHEIPSGTRVGDWVVPNEWNLRRARLFDPDGNTVCDTAENNLHVLGYSLPHRGQLSLDDLDEHLYSLPEQPDAIPYITSYYQPRWGFCLSDRVRKSLPQGNYFVDIDTSLEPGSMTYGDVFIAGESTDEILITTYICHPSMANNEISGPVVTAELINYLSELGSRRYSYRFVFAPETIGAVAYIHANLQNLKERVKSGFVVTCVGDNRAFSLLPSRDGTHEIDLIARHVLKQVIPKYVEYPWTSRGSDERQYSAPLVDIPMISMMRTKYWEYPEYHTSLDRLGTVVTPEGLAGGFESIRQAIDVLETNVTPTTEVIGEPMLGPRGLYATLGAGKFSVTSQTILDVWSFCDGKHSVLEIADQLQLKYWNVLDTVNLLCAHHLVRTNPRYLP